MFENPQKNSLQGLFMTLLVYYLKKGTPHQQFITARKNFNETVKLTNLLKNLTDV